MRALAWTVLLLLGACKEEPDFDARYKAAAKEIESRAKALDTAATKSGEKHGAEPATAVAAADGPASGQ